MEQLAVTEDGNFLISKFMGFTYPNREDNVWKISLLGLHNYHEDWNVLMPVVEKISRIQCIWLNAIADETDTYYPRTFGMLNSETKNPMVRFNSNQVYEAPTLIEATWLAVVEFIKDYQNLNK
jgi:hypothetical protein